MSLRDHDQPSFLSNGQVSRLRSRICVLVGAVGLVFATPQCSWTGLDAYSSEFGNSGGGGGAGGGGGSITPDPDPSCVCAPNEECVNGVCETCLPMWSYDHKALRQGDQRGIDHAYDPARKTLYVASARQDGQDPSRAYLAELHTCRGTLLREHDGPVVEGKKVPGLQVLRRRGDLLFGKLRQDDPATSPSGYAVYDTTAGSFARLVQAPRFKPDSKSEGLWSLEVSAAGKVWMFGSWEDSFNVVTPLSMHSDDAGNVCLAEYSNLAPAFGRAIATNNDDVYMAAPKVDVFEVRVLRFKDSTCDIASCNCPSIGELPPLVLPAFPAVMASKIVGSTLVVAGFYVKTDTDWVGYVAQYNFVNNSWTKTYYYDPTPSFDGFIALDSDGSKVYAVSFQDYDPNNPNVSGTNVFVFDLPITDVSQPKKIEAPNIRGAYAITLDGDALLLTGYSPSSAADGRSMRCTLSACP